MALLLSVGVFVVVTLLITVFGYRRYVLVGRVYENLETKAINLVDLGMPEPESSPVSRMAEYVGGTMPRTAETASALQLKLQAAGYRAQNAVKILYGLKLMLMTGTTLLMVMFGLNSDASLLFRFFTVL